MKEVCCVDMYLMYFFTMLLQVPTTNAMSRNKGQTKNIKNRYTRYSYSKNIIMYNAGVPLFCFAEYHRHGFVLLVCMFVYGCGDGITVTSFSFDLTCLHAIYCNFL